MKVRLSTIAIYGVVVLSSAALMWTSQRVQESERTLRSLQAARDETQDNLHMMQAEWAYLTRPERLEQLAVQYLPALAPMNPAQLRDDYNFATPVIDEVPTGPALLPQEAAMKVPVKPVAAQPAGEAVTSSSDLSTSPSPKAASPAVSPTAPQAQAIQAAAIAPAGGTPSEDAAFSHMIKRVGEQQPTPADEDPMGGGR